MSGKGEKEGKWNSKAYFYIVQYYSAFVYFHGFTDNTIVAVTDFKPFIRVSTYDAILYYLSALEELKAIKIFLIVWQVKLIPTDNIYA